MLTPLYSSQYKLVIYIVEQSLLLMCKSSSVANILCSWLTFSLNAFKGSHNRLRGNYMNQNGAWSMTFAMCLQYSWIVDVYFVTSAWHHVYIWTSVLFMTIDIYWSSVFWNNPYLSWLIISKYLLDHHVLPRWTWNADERGNPKQGSTKEKWQSSWKVYFTKAQYVQKPLERWSRDSLLVRLPLAPVSQSPQATYVKHSFLYMAHRFWGETGLQPLHSWKKDRQRTHLCFGSHFRCHSLALSLASVSVKRLTGSHDSYCLVFAGWFSIFLMLQRNHPPGSFGPEAWVSFPWIVT